MSFEGFTLDWYKSLFSDKEILNALSNTLLVATVSAVLSTLIGTLASIGILKLKRLPKKIVLGITDFPMINPEIIMGVSFMLLFSFIRKQTGFLEHGIFSLILSHTTFCLPYVILSVMPKLRSAPPNMYRAALDLGMTPTNAFLKVILREILPGVITGALMAFTISVDDFVVSYFTSGSVQTLSIAIYSMSKKSISPEINALSSILFLLVIILLVIINAREVKEARNDKKIT